jgi:hypothetical protein
LGCHVLVYEFSVYLGQILMIYLNWFYRSAELVLGTIKVRNSYNISVGNLRERGKLKYSGIDGNIILKTGRKEQTERFVHRLKPKIGNRNVCYNT